jgi:hypothetical protein
MKTTLWVVASLLLIPGVWGQESPANRPDRGPDSVRPFLVKTCQECHGAEKAKGKFRVDQLDFNLSSKAAEQRWPAVKEQVTSGAMPSSRKTPEARPSGSGSASRSDGLPSDPGVGIDVPPYLPVTLRRGSPTLPAPASGLLLKRK